MRIAVLLVLAVLTFLAAAKAHGRQVRLEREREGYDHVVFGGSNPPFVEALWQRERVRVWGLVGVMFAASLITVIALVATGRPLPFDARWWSAILAGVVCSFVVSFTISGAWSWISHTLAGGGGHLGSAAWWAIVLALSAATTFAAARHQG